MWFCFLFCASVSLFLIGIYIYILLLTQITRLYCVFFGLFWFCLYMCVCVPLFFFFSIWFCFYHLTGSHFLYVFIFCLFICLFLCVCFNPLYCHDKWLWDLSSPAKSRDLPSPCVWILTPGHKIDREILTPGSINQWECPQTSPSKYKTQHNPTACSTQPCMSNPNNKKTGTKGNHHQRGCLQKTQNTLLSQGPAHQRENFIFSLQNKSTHPPNMKPTVTTDQLHPKVADHLESTTNL